MTLSRSIKEGERRKFVSCYPSAGARAAEGGSGRGPRSRAGRGAGPEMPSQCPLAVLTPPGGKPGQGLGLGLVRAGPVTVTRRDPGCLDHKPYRGLEGSCTAAPTPPSLPPLHPAKAANFRHSSDSTLSLTSCTPVPQRPALCPLVPVAFFCLFFERKDANEGEAEREKQDSNMGLRLRNHEIMI